MHKPNRSRAIGFKAKPALGQLSALALAFAFITIVFLYPVASLLQLGLSPNNLNSPATPDSPNTLDTSNTPAAGTNTLLVTLGQESTWLAVKETLILASLATAISIGLGLYLAGALYRYRLRAGGIFKLALTLPFVLPTIGVATAFKALFAAEGYLGFLGWQQSRAAVIAAMVFYNTALVARTIGPVWVRLDRGLIEVAKSLGTKPKPLFTQIVLPQLSGAIASAAALVFLYCCSSYSLVMVLGGVGVSTLEKEIYTRTSIDLDLAGAGALSLLQITIVVLALLLSNYLQKKASRCLTLQAKARYLPQTPAAQIYIASAYILIGAGFILPIWQVVWRSLHRAGEFTFANYIDLFNPDASILLAASAGSALRESFTSALGGAIVATMVGTAVALLVSGAEKQGKRKKTRYGFKPRAKLGGKGLRFREQGWAASWPSRGKTALKQLLDYLYMLPLGVSAVTIGLGMLVSLAAPPWNLAEAGILLPLAQALVAIPVVLRVLKPALAGIDQELKATSVLCGASPGQVWWEVDRRVLQVALGSAFAFAFAICFGEFGAASFLVLPEKATLPVLIYRLQLSAGAVENGMATAGAVLLCVVNALVMGAAQGLFQRETGEKTGNNSRGKPRKVPVGQALVTH